MDKGTILITGANGALGCSLVSHILRSPPYASTHGIFTVRSVTKAASLTRVVGPPNAPSHDNHHSHEILPLDLCSIASVRSFAAAVNRRVSAGQLAPIRAVVLNAGFQEHFTLSKTQDNLDMSFQVNHLSHFLLTLLLLESLDVEQAKIVVIGSWTHDPDDTRNMAGLYPDEFRPLLASGVSPLALSSWSPPERDPTAAAGIRRYGASKLCQIAMMLELQRRLDADPVLSKVCVSGLDPGGMPSGIMRHASFLQAVIINNIAGRMLAPITTWWQPNGILRTPRKSAADVMRILAETGAQTKGVYFNGDEVAIPSEEARDPKTCQMVWGESLRLVDLQEGETALHSWQ